MSIVCEKMIHTVKKWFTQHGPKWLIRATHIDDSCHTYECVMSHIWMSHVHSLVALSCESWKDTRVQMELVLVDYNSPQGRNAQKLALSLFFRVHSITRCLLKNSQKRSSKVSFIVILQTIIESGLTLRISTRCALFARRSCLAVWLPGVHASHTWEWDVSHIKESCRIWRSKVCHIWMRHDAHDAVMWPFDYQVCMIHVTYIEVRHVTYERESCRVWRIKACHIWMRHDAHDTAMWPSGCQVCSAWFMLHT